MTKLLEHGGIVGGDWFSFIWCKRGDDKRKKTLQEYIENVDLDEYWIYKYSNKQRLVSVKEFMDFTYCGYIFFRKSKYDIDHIDLWVNELNIIMNNKSGYLVKPLPPYSPEKIKIKK